MKEVLELKSIVESMISSYESRIDSIGSISDTAYLMLTDFQKSILDTKEEREKANSELRDSLAKNGNLRKKDFDSMMQNILNPQNEKEKEVRNLLGDYLNDQKEMANALKDNFVKIKDALAKGEIKKIKGLLGVIKELMGEQDRKKEDLALKLKELQWEQEDVVTEVRALLVKGRQLQIRDLKEMLAQIRHKREERIAQGLERKKEIRGMLANFRKQRIEVASKWKKPQKVAISPEAINIGLKRNNNAGEAQIKK